MSRKKWVSGMGIAIAVGIGGAVGMAVDVFVFPVWFEWLFMPVSQFLESHGEDLRLEGLPWNMVLGHVPVWAVAAILGAAVAKLRPRRWLGISAATALGYVAVPQLWLLWLKAHSMVLRPVLWDVAAALVCIAAAWFTVVRARSRAG